MIKTFTIDAKFRQISRDELLNGLVVYYCIGSKANNINGPCTFIVEEEQQYLQNRQGVKVSMRFFPTVTFWIKES